MARTSSVQCVFVVIVVCCIVASQGFADTVLLKDGRFFSGHLLSRDDKVVRFEIVHASGARVQTTFPASEVAKVHKGELATLSPTTRPGRRSGKEAAASGDAERIEGPSYYVIPIIGPIGRRGARVTAGLIDACLRHARRVRATVVILEIDSQGGSVGETMKIINLLGGVKDLRLVAYVRTTAGSAAAIIALVCKEIYLDERATCRYGTQRNSDQVQRFVRQTPD